MPRCRRRRLTSLLAQVQKRRLLPARITQAVQVAIQNRVLAPVLASAAGATTAPWPCPGRCG